MAGEKPECPCCMEDVTRPVVTICTHVFCYVCTLSILTAGQPFAPKCPVCRRNIKKEECMEVMDDQI